mmetsp:Transcript_11289/g.34016  ORF Transcript_11289/g.34016 Transcript_11289/m.34016 type:complete len:204 (-) Transcript_11289:229-840(-)
MTKTEARISHQQRCHWPAGRENHSQPGGGTSPSSARTSSKPEMPTEGWYGWPRTSLPCTQAAANEASSRPLPRSMARRLRLLGGGGLSSSSSARSCSSALTPRSTRSSLRTKSRSPRSSLRSCCERSKLTCAALGSEASSSQRWRGRRSGFCRMSCRRAKCSMLNPGKSAWEAFVSFNCRRLCTSTPQSAEAAGLFTSVPKLM